MAKAKKLLTILNRLDCFLSEAEGRIVGRPKDFNLRSILDMTDEEIFGQMSGSAITDDPPKGLTSKKQMAMFLRGYLYAEFKRSRSTASNLSRLKRMLNDL